MPRSIRKPTPPRPRSTVAISSRDLKDLEQLGPAALIYFRRTGLAETRARSIQIGLAGIIPLIGLALFDWSPVALVLYLVADGLVTLFADLIKLTIAPAAVAAAHQTDHRAGRLLGISDGLEDGTGERTDTGPRAPRPGLILFFGALGTLLLGPLFLAALNDAVGFEEARALLATRSFQVVVALDAATRILGALVTALRARLAPAATEPEDAPLLFIESGSTMLLYFLLLALVFLPLQWGMPGLIALFIIVCLGRLAFSLFALTWMPRAVDTLERRLRERDFSVRPRAPRKTRTDAA